MPTELEPPRRPAPVGVRGGVLLGLLALGGWAWIHLDLGVSGLLPGEGGLEIAREFFARAFTPALVSEADFVPPGTPPLLVLALEAIVHTIVFAAAALSLSLVLGVILGFFASTAWWAGDPAGGRSVWRLVLGRTVAPAVYGITRTVIAVMRSVHEILWAVLFLAAFGLNNVSALLAIAIPYGGVFAKIFSEMVDEAPRGGAHAMRGAGASNLQVFFFGLVSRATPDMTAYAFYRFECALRSSAVLGFFGFETLGLYLRQSFHSLNYGEVWTYLYALIATVVIFDWWSGSVRRRLVGGHSVRISLTVMAVMMAGSWWVGGFDFGDAFSERRMDNLARFAGEVRPYPLQGQPWDWEVAGRWASSILDDKGYAAVTATLAISVLAILLAAVIGYALALPAARNFATPEPFAPSGSAPTAKHRMLWRSVVAVTRFALIGLRAVPEYIWAFLLLAMLGPTAWPAVLALAIHNAGILGRLGAETVENVEPRTVSALRVLGARRMQLAAVGLLPATLPRLLLYFFYRWETCVREATVLGMLGVVSLGYWIADARTRMQHDTFVFLILLGALIVLAGDLVSAVARRLVREAA